MIALLVVVAFTLLGHANRSVGLVCTDARHLTLLQVQQQLKKQSTSSLGPIVRTKSRRCEADLAARASSDPTDIPPTTSNQRNNRVDWSGRVKELREFSQHYGHTLVPKRYKENKSLGAWVNKQRQEFRKFRLGVQPCSFTSTKFTILDEMGFCWDASNVTASVVSGKQKAPSTDVANDQDQSWWHRFEQLKQSNCTSLAELGRDSALGKFLEAQRANYHAILLQQQLGRQRVGAWQTTTKADRERMQALHDLNPDWWMTRRELQWECRFRELLSYRREYGDCCVPISFAKNPQLANWVSYQRKQYNRKRKGKASALTRERQERLESIDFVWNRWEYEFAIRETQWVQDEKLPLP